jgi:hypothetical protein
VLKHLKQKYICCTKTSCFETFAKLQPYLRTIIILKNDLQYIVHGKGLLKFNNSLLFDLEYLNCINDKIDNAILQYLLHVCNIHCLKNVSYEDLQFSIDDQLFLETLLMAIRGKTICFRFSHL